MEMNSTSSRARFVVFIITAAVLVLGNTSTAEEIESSETRMRHKGDSVITALITTNGDFSELDRLRLTYSRIANTNSAIVCLRLDQVPALSYLISVVTVSVNPPPEIIKSLLKATGDKNNLVDCSGEQIFSSKLDSLRDFLFVRDFIELRYDRYAIDTSGYEPTIEIWLYPPYDSSFVDSIGKHHYKMGTYPGALGTCTILIKDIRLLASHGIKFTYGKLVKHPEDRTYRKK